LRNPWLSCIPPGLKLFTSRPPLRTGLF